LSIRKQRLLPVLVPGLLFAIGAGSSALADLTVIYDSGQTQALSPLLGPLQADESPATDPAKASDPNRSSKSMLGPAALSNLLPLRSPGLEVGDSADSSLNPEVLTRLAQGNPRPFFLIGSDAVSLQWLAYHRDTLRSLGAVGMLVQADTEADVRRVADVAQGLSITLGSGSDLAAALGIERYPVLITPDGIRQ
jgi:integrating conjugative element protein (TIGR03765 family)